MSPILDPRRCFGSCVEFVLLTRRMLAADSVKGEFDIMCYMLRLRQVWKCEHYALLNEAEMQEEEEDVYNAYYIR